jgi:hypothetical protein
MTAVTLSRRRLSKPEIQKMHSEMIICAKAILDGQGSEAVPHDGITWGVELASGTVSTSVGFDKLKCGFHVEWKDSELLDLLGDWKSRAQEVHDSVAVSLPGFSGDEPFIIHTSGRKGGFAFHLSRADLDIFFSCRKDWMATPNVWVDIGSVSCWVPGWRHTLDLVEDIIARFGGKIHKIGLSEVHLCTDFIGVDIKGLGLHSYDNWITRANVFHPYYQRSRFSGVEFSQTEGPLGISDKPFDIVGSTVVENGLRVGQGDIMLRVYDKVLELQRDGAKQIVFASLWGTEEYSEHPVTRVEFQLRRPVLRQLGVDSLNDLLEKLSGVWEYCACRWAVLCAEAPDRLNRHQDRAEIHEFWKMVQNADWGGYQPVTRKKIMPLKDKHQNADQLVGCALNLAAIGRCPENVDDLIGFVKDEVADWCRVKALEIDPRTGRSVLLAKLQRKKAEIWPHGMDAEVHGA